MKPALAPRFVSYSANFEDVLLQRLFGDRDRGFYVDVGAGHPEYENDTKLLYDRGWSGINVEPNPSLFNQLERERPRDRNYGVVLGDAEGESVLYIVVGTGLSTCNPEFAARARENGHRIVERRTPMRTLASLLDEVAPESIDLLKVDVEGFEPQVLAGNNWQKYQPAVIIVEATYPESPSRRPTAIRSDLEGRNYEWRHFDGLNDFYVRRDVRLPDGAFDSPPNVFDRFTLRSVADLEDRIAQATHAYETARDYAVALEGEVKRAQVEPHGPDAGQPEAEPAAPPARPGLREQQLEQERERLQFALDDERFEREALAKAAARMRAEILEFSGALDRATRTAEERDQARHELQEARDALAQARTALAAEEATSRRLLSELDAARAALAASAEGQARERARLQRDVERMSAAALEAERHVAHATAQYSSILHSRSWRLMAPVRGVMQTLRRLRRRSIITPHEPD